MKQVFLITAVCTLCCIGAFCIGTENANGQNYTQTPVTISKDIVRNREGQTCYWHNVEERQTLYSIAKAYGVTIDEICEANKDQDLRKNGLKKGTPIYIPFKKEAKNISKETESTDNPQIAENPVSASTDTTDRKGDNFFIYVRKWFEDLGDIAKKYSIPEEVLKKFNGLKSSKLKIRQKIRIPYDYASIMEEGDDADKEVTENGEQPTIENETDQNSFDIKKLFTKKAKVNALLMLPLNAGGKPVESNIDFYCGVLMALEDLKKNGITVDFSVYDVASGIPVTRERLAESDLTIGPLKKEDLQRVLDLAPASTAVISPLDPRASALTATHSNFIHAPASLKEQYADMTDWIRSEYQSGDKVIVISEKGKETGSMLNSVIAESGLPVQYYSYNILNGREAVNAIEKIMSTGANRIIINSESEAFINDAVRNLATLVYRKHNVVLYSPSKIRSYDTIDPDNLHSLNTRVSASYCINYNDSKVSDFLMRYRALFGTEPTQFSFQGYDLTYYFINMKYKYGNEWLEEIVKTEERGMTQVNLKFRQDGAGISNKGIRRSVFGPNYSVSY